MRINKDFYSGILITFFGILAIIIARDYRMGTAANMGPGYFPTVLGGIFTCLGLAITGRAFWDRGEAVKRWGARPLVFVLGSMVAFALVIRPLGLVLGTLALVVISSLGCWKFRVREVTVLYVVLVILAIGIFVYGLGMPLKVWPK